MRGMITDKIQEISKEKIGREITQKELRLMPYIQFQMMNEQKLDPRKINSEERKIFMNWKKEGFCDGGVTGLGITKEFWDYINEVLFEGYVKGAKE